MQRSHDTKRSFAPVITDNAAILILGSIPGDRSIAENEYYAHPRNRFWSLLAELTGSKQANSYSEKLRLLSSNGISLWDVAEKANRKGSMDSAIKEYTVNDIDRLLTENPTIRVVVFNGKTAERLYRDNFDEREGVKYLSMPSTSPANAAYGMERLCGRWCKITEYIRIYKEQKKG